MTGIYAAIKYEGKLATTIYYKTNEYYAIYDKIYSETKDHKISEEAASWCELADINEVFVINDKIEIEIIDTDAEVID